MNSYKDCITETTLALIGDIKWHGETNADEEALANREIAMDLIAELLHVMSVEGLRNRCEHSAKEFCDQWDSFAKECICAYFFREVDE